MNRSRMSGVAAYGYQFNGNGQEICTVVYPFSVGFFCVLGVTVCKIFCLSKVEEHLKMWTF